MTLSLSMPISGAMLSEDANLPRVLAADLRTA